MIPTILVVASDPVPFAKKLKTVVENMAHIKLASTGMEGIFTFNKSRPVMVIVDSKLPDISGESLSTIIKDSPGGAETVIYLINITVILHNTKADYYISQPVNEDVFCLQLKQDLERLLLITSRSDEIEKAITIQRGMLPPQITNDKFEIEALYSPYNALSGDGLYYWYPKVTDKRDSVFGFLFDCTGHDLSSYGQASSLWVSLRHGMDFLQKGMYANLAEVMQSINDDTMEYYKNSDEPNMSAAIIFQIDFKSGLICYCPAGNPEIRIKRNGQKIFEAIKLKSAPIGFDENTVYKESQVPLGGIEEIIFASDGLSELLIANQSAEYPPESAKHDDVSAIFVKFQNGEKGKSL